MRLLSFEHAGRRSFGALADGGIVDLGRRLAGENADLRSALETWTIDALRDAAARSGPDLAPAEVRYLPPVVAPEKIVCVGVNYVNRNAEYRDGSDLPTYPSLFLRTPGSIVGHEELIVRPKESAQLDYEGEIALVIGRGGRRIPRERALDAVAGISCFNEGSVRDWMRHGKFNVTQGKNFDRTGAFGPWLVTADEIADWQRLTVTTRVNGELRQHDSAEHLLFPFDYLISYISTFTTLRPGDVIATGTPTGAGARFDPPRYLEPGDVVEVSVSGVGTLCNRVVDEP